jgi:hypothetical protein
LAKTDNLVTIYKMKTKRWLVLGGACEDRWDAYMNGKGKGAGTGTGMAI